MKNREYDYAFRFGDEEDRVRKTPKKNAADFAMHGLIVLVILVRLLNCVVEFGHEPASEALEL